MALPYKLTPRLCGNGRGDQLIYIHGFNSSSQAMKACLLSDHLQAQQLPVQYWTPDLPGLPAAALARLTELVQHCLSLAAKNSGRVALLGSSLGGYYAAWLAQQFGLAAVLVNPAVYPYRHMARHIGPQRNPYSGECYELSAQHITRLQQWDVPVFNQPERIMIMVQTGDEVLDYREAIAKYPDCRHLIEPGGDHHFQHFERHLATIMQFLQLTANDCSGEH